MVDWNRHVSILNTNASIYQGLLSVTVESDGDMKEWVKIRHFVVEFMLVKKRQTYAIQMQPVKIWICRVHTPVNALNLFTVMARLVLYQVNEINNSQIIFYFKNPLWVTITTDKK